MPRGGPRSNSGGARAGAGRPPKEPVKVAATAHQEPLEFLLQVMNDGEVPVDLRIAAARAAAQYVHLRRGGIGKKEAKAEVAKEAAGGRFAASPLPRLLVKN